MLGREVRPYRTGQRGTIDWEEEINWRNAVEVQDDGWCALTVVLLLEEGPNSFPKMAYGVTLQIKVLDDRVVLRLPNFLSLERGVEIKWPLDEDAMTDFAESVAAAMLEDLSTEFARYVESGERRRGIGFDIEGWPLADVAKSGSRSPRNLLSWARAACWNRDGTTPRATTAQTRSSVETMCGSGSA